MTTQNPTIFEGKYEVIGKIAEGGMGAIFKVRHVLLNEIRVIKVMRPAAAEKEEHRKRFLREAQTLTKLKHPNIVNFYDFAVDENDNSYMVMEFIDGVTFNQLIRGGGPVPVPTALVLAKQCLSALAYLHRRGIVHRDVSPDNILLAADEEAGAQSKLIDLGIAKAMQEESLTVGAAFIGKIRYCSPEQLGMGASLDGRSDVFSFGIVLSEMLTGICPLPGGSAQSVLMAHVTGRFLPFEKTDPNGRVPGPLREIVNRALQIERSARTQSAEEFSQQLDDFVSRSGLRVPTVELRAFADRAVAARPVTMPRPASSGGSPLDVSRLPTLKLDAPTAAPEPAPAPPAPVEKTELWTGTGGAESSSLGPTAPPAAPSTPPVAAKEAPIRSFPAARSVPARPGVVEPEAKRKRLSWLFGAAAVAVAGIAVYWALNRTPAASKEASRLEERTPAPSPAPTAIPQPTSPPPTVPPPTVPAPTALPRPTFHPKPSPPPGVAPPVTTRFNIYPPPVKTPRLNRERLRFCTNVEPTSYAQATASEKPAGFDTGGGEVFRGPRPDAARIKIKVDVTPPQPLEGEPFRVVARLLNGGDLGITLARVEESAPMARGGFQAVNGVATPTTVQVGGSLTVYSFEGVLTEGSAYSKDIRVTDAVGDSWKTSVRVAVCPE